MNSFQRSEALFKCLLLFSYAVQVGVQCIDCDTASAVQFQHPVTLRRVGLQSRLKRGPIRLGHCNCSRAVAFSGQLVDQVAWVAEPALDVIPDSRLQV
jgi:hypothetical protein